MVELNEKKTLNVKKAKGGFRSAHSGLFESSCLKVVCAMGTPSRFSGGQVVDICQSDSGGPVVRFVDNLKEEGIKKRWSKDEKEERSLFYYLEDGVAPLRGQLIGVTSWSYGCGEGTPGVYTRVTEYMNWIKKYTDKMSTSDDKII